MTAAEPLPAVTAAPERSPLRRERLIVVVALVALGAGVVLTSTRTFSTLVLRGVSGPLVIPGSQAAPALAPVGIVLLALAVALTIAGRVARVVLGVVLVLLGAAVVALALPSALDATAGTRGAIIAAEGVTDVGPTIVSVAGTAWPVAAAAFGALAALLGLVVVVRGRAWPVGGRRYRAEGTAAPVSTDPVDEWDALTRGADPTDQGPQASRKPDEPSA